MPHGSVGLILATIDVSPRDPEHERQKRVQEHIIITI